MLQFLIDTATYSRMSGAPVILRSESYQDNKGNVNHVISQDIPTKLMQTFLDSKNLAVEKNNEILYLQ
jgi:hypothetical protein